MKLVDGIRTIFSSEPFMQFSFSLRDDEVATLNFVKTLLRFSYHTQNFIQYHIREFITHHQSQFLGEFKTC